MMFIWFIIIGVLLYYILQGDIELPKPQKKPRALLDERLARGEISMEEYEQIKQQLED